MKAFTLIGISVRTTNKNNQSATDLGNLWKQFYELGIADKVPARVGKDIYVIYTDYESDYTGAYTALIGVPVDGKPIPPDGMVIRSFQEQPMKLIPVRGKMPDAVIQAWIEIWKNDGLLKRKYSYDMEVYSSNQDEMEIHLSVK